MEFTISYADHDLGAKDGSMTRMGRERAEWSANLLRECGYQTVTVVESP